MRGDRGHRRLLLCVAVSAAVVALLMAAVAASAAPFAPVDQPGPPIDVPEAKLAASLTCSADVGHSDKQPVLLVPGTAGTFEVQFKWNFAIALSKKGIPWCGISPPYAQLGDIQTAGAYDAFAIRYLYHASHNRPIAVVGHSQGGMQPRWALRFWPDTRAMVADQVGIAPDNQGVTVLGIFPALNDLCHAGGSCPMTVYQQANNSNFIEALNSHQEMFPGIDYTVIYSDNDGGVEPSNTVLHGPGSYTRTSIQEVCPGRSADHLRNGTVDSVSWALTLDAITHAGPASAKRVPSGVCSQAIIPELDPVATLAAVPVAAAGFAANFAQAQGSNGEPPLRCYVFATCTGASAPTLTLRTTSTPRRLSVRGRMVLRASVRSQQGGVATPVPGAVLTLAGRRQTTDARGRAVFVMRFKRTGRYRLYARRPGTNPASSRVTVGR